MNMIVVNMAMDYAGHLLANPEDRAKGATFRKITDQKFEAIIKLKSNNIISREFDLGSVPSALLFRVKQMLLDSIRKIEDMVDNMDHPELPDAV